MHSGLECSTGLRDMCDVRARHDCEVRSGVEGCGEFGVDDGIREITLRAFLSLGIRGQDADDLDALCCGEQGAVEVLAGKPVSQHDRPQHGASPSHGG
jgi:hypothetical protein